MEPGLIESGFFDKGRGTDLKLFELIGPGKTRMPDCSDWPDGATFGFIDGISVAEDIGADVNALPNELFSPFCLP